MSEQQQIQTTNQATDSPVSTDQTNNSLDSENLVGENVSNETSQSNDSTKSTESTESTESTNVFKPRNSYEVVFFTKYLSGKRPSVDDITTFFTNYGSVHHVNCPENRNCAFVFMTSLNTNVEHRRTRTTISQIIHDMTPENKFYITVADGGSKRFRNKPNDQSRHSGQYQPRNLSGKTNISTQSQFTPRLYGKQYNYNQPNRLQTRSVRPNYYSGYRYNNRTGNQEFYPMQPFNNQSFNNQSRTHQSKTYQHNQQKRSFNGPRNNGPQNNVPRFFQREETN